MQNESDSVSHQPYFCIIKSGESGEITVRKPLPFEQVKTLQDHPEAIAQICPGGEVESADHTIVYKAVNLEGQAS